MGLDSCVKAHLRQQTPAAFSYFETLTDLYKNRPYDAVIVDMNVELFRKPQHVLTGIDWAEYIFRTRVRSPPGCVCVLLFDSPARVPATKDMTHLKRANAGSKRKRAVPLSADTVFGDNIPLPEWSRVTSSKSVLPALWSYLIDALGRIACSHPDFNKALYVDAPMSSRHRAVSPYMDGAIHCLAEFPGRDFGVPSHRFGEGDLKTLAWVTHLRAEHNFDRILVYSTDLDNIGMFSRSDMVGVDLIGNSVPVDSRNSVVPQKDAVRKVHEVIGLGTIAVSLKGNERLFRTILVMGNTDFNISVDSITTDRMLKTFFRAMRKNYKIDADKLITCEREYAKFKMLCYSKILGNRARPAKKPFATSAKVVPYLHRCQWIKSYWEGKEQKLGGPRPLQGWKKPDTSMGLGVYSGKVRLVPV